MRTSDGSCGTVLHRLIQEQLRFGNLTDPRSLLAIRQQALLGGGPGGGRGPRGPRSSLESLTPEETRDVQMSARQEPQGQEHRGDGPHCEGGACHLYRLHGEELPTYEEAKAHARYGASGANGEGQWDLKRGHARSLSERLLQLALQRNGPRDGMSISASNSVPQLDRQGPQLDRQGPQLDRQGPHSVPQLDRQGPHSVPQLDRQGPQLDRQGPHSVPQLDRQGPHVVAPDQRGPPPDYVLSVRPPGYMLSHSQETNTFYCTQQQRSLSSDSAQSDVLKLENEWLKAELQVFVEKAARLQKLESEIRRISEAYETLMEGSTKRETLEKTMRNKLEAEIKRLQDFNRDLRDQLDSANKQRATREAECSDQRHHMLVNLQSEEQQKELEHLEKQVQLLRVSGEECQRRRDQLDRALASTLARNRQLEAELQRKRAYVEKVERLQSALVQLQAACDKRETLELRLRTRLEQELKNLRAQQNQPLDPAASEPSGSTLQQQLREKEERVLALEADVTRWEQKYLEESSMRQFAMDAAATAAAQRDTTVINHSPNNSFNEDLLLSSHRHQEMENRIRALHAQLLEKDAVIRVIQQRCRWEQNKLQNQRLRPARSVPSISTVSSSTERKEKSLSDDQTGAAMAALQPRHHERPRGPRPDSAPQSEECELTAEPEELQTSGDASEELPKTFRSIDGSDADVVEILI